jgi:opacity protein-like surface antigen
MRLAPLAAVLAAAVALPACASPSAEGGWYSGDPSGRMDFDRMGPYVGLYGIQSMEAFDTSGTGLDADDSDVGIGVRGGLRLDRNLAVEASIESVDGYELSSGTASVDLELLNFVVAGKYYLVPGRIQPYVLAGLGWADADVDALNLDDSGSFARVGAGADLYLTPAVAAFGEVTYNRMFNDLDDLDHYDLVIGLLFRF